jgi:hypothetical protein
MVPVDRFRLRFSLGNAMEPKGSGHETATKLKGNFPVRVCPLQASDRMPPCFAESRVETINPRIRSRSILAARTPNVRPPYHYFSIRIAGRYSENSCRYCGNLAPSTFVASRTRLIKKHLDLFQNGPTLANCVLPARVLVYWCPNSLSC